MANLSSNTYVPCLAWVKRGATKSQLEKVKHTREEVLEIIKEMKLKEAEFSSRPEANSADKNIDENDSSDSENEVDDYYGLDGYDDDIGDAVVGIDQGVEHLLLNNVPESESEDSDAEPDEFTVKNDDNLILVGRIDKDIPMLEIMVFNHKNAEFFILHDILLPSFPFAIEWLDFNAKDTGNLGSFAAVGGINPEIDVWDLNVSGSLEPAFRLSSKKKSQRHSDAVLDLSWNRLTRNVLASGSADHTVRLWDMAQNVTITKLTAFEEKVQSVKWHSSESQNLLVGSCDGKVRLFDCRSPSAYKTWSFEEEIERVLWSEVDPLQYYTTSDKGKVYLVDVRNTKPLWSLKAHEKEVTGICVTKHSGVELMVTASMDETVKVWDLMDSKQEMICQKFMNIGPIFTLTSCPDVPYVFCAGGSKKDNSLYLWDARESEDVLNRFKRGPANPKMDVDQEPKPCTSSSLTSGTNVGGRIQQSGNKTTIPSEKPSTATSKNKKKKTKKTSHKSLHPKTPKDKSKDK